MLEAFFSSEAGFLLRAMALVKQKKAAETAAFFMMPKEGFEPSPT